MKPYRVGLVGLGTIGMGVATLLLQHRERIERAVRRPVELAVICDNDWTRERDIALPPGILTDDVAQIADDPTIETVIELVGGTGFAKTLVLSMLEKGKNIITANKALIANFGAELFETARQRGKTIAFEAAVCGGIPILGTMQTMLQPNVIESIHAIVNGTSNFILTQMEEKGADYQDAVCEAQRLGYAEADPTLDVDGSDAVQKLTILAQLAYGVQVDWKTIPKQGIQSVGSIDIQYAKELGYRIRLLAVAEMTPTGLELHVSPTLVDEDSPLADVRDAFNAVRICGDAVGPVFLHGYGAGRMPTASSVVGDLIDTILGRTAITFNAMQCWSGGQSAVSLKDPAEIVGPSYLRLLVRDQPGVLHEISGVLGQFGISVASLIQHSQRQSENGYVPLILTTHDAKEGNLIRAIETISALDCVKGEPVRIRVRDF